MLTLSRAKAYKINEMLACSEFSAPPQCPHRALAAGVIQQAVDDLQYHFARQDFGPIYRDARDFLQGLGSHRFTARYWFSLLGLPLCAAETVERLEREAAETMERLRGGKS